MLVIYLGCFFLLPRSLFFQSLLQVFDLGFEFPDLVSLFSLLCAYIQCLALIGIYSLQLLVFIDQNLYFLVVLFYLVLAVYHLLEAWVLLELFLQLGDSYSDISRLLKVGVVLL